MSVVKVLIAMETNTIPATLQYTTPNANIEGLVEGRLEVVAKNREWCGKYAAVNAIGLSPTYGHVLLKANRKPKVPSSSTLPQLVVMSSRNEQGMAKALNKARDHYLHTNYILSTRTRYPTVIIQCLARSAYKP